MQTTKYLTEINSFYNWVEFNPLSPAAHALWHTLMSRNNKCAVRTPDGTFWRVYFTVANPTLFGLLKLTNKMQLKRPRDELIMAGRIKYIPGTKAQCGTYKMIPFDESLVEGEVNGIKVWMESYQSVTYPVTNSVTNTVTDPLPMPLPICDHYIDIDKDIDIDLDSSSNMRARAREQPENDLPPMPKEKTIPEEIRTALDKAVIMLTPTRAEKLMSWLTDMEPSAIAYAIEQADAHGKNNIAYIEGILRSYQREGIKTGEQAKQRDMEFNSRKRFRDRDSSVYTPSGVDFDEIERRMNEKY